MDINIGRCGLACEFCKRFNKECLGCEEQNRLENNCIIYNCAVKKGIKYCIQCPEAPCNLMRGLSKAYCPVCSELTI
ncbi:MAG: DUF3795 domain-containing protein, partial [Candidatus Methanoperedens sp.]|nr:DUF3795 domain-containing protein [Candidatus Methanoperedens sp.]